MKTLKNFLRATIFTAAPLLIGGALNAQGFCTFIGDGVASTRYQEIRKLIPYGNDIAFAGYNGYNNDDMETFLGVARTDGSLIWSKSYNLLAPNQEKVNAILRTNNGDLVVASNGLDNFALLRVNGSNGNLIDEQQFPEGYSVAKLFEQPNGQIIAFARDVKSTNLVALRFNSDLQFSDGLSIGANVEPKDMIKIGSNYYGVGIRTIGGYQRGVVFQLNGSLTPAWINEITTGNGHHLLLSIDQMGPGTILVCGYDGFCTEANPSRIILHGFTTAGNYLSTKTISSSSNCLHGIDMKVLPSGNIIITGEKVDGHFDNLTVGLNSAGEFLQATTHLFGIGNAIAVSSTNQVLVGGQGENNLPGVQGQTEGFLTGFDNLGGNCCSAPYTCEVQGMLCPPTPLPLGNPHPITLAGTTSVLASNFGQNTYFCQPTAPRMANPEETQLSISPNPASSEVNIAIPEKGGSIMQIYDLKGQLILEKSLHQGTQSVSVEHLESGLYMARITTNKNVSTHRLVIAR